MQSEQLHRLEDDVRNALRIVMDPELGINLVDLGMIYMITAHANGDVSVKMTTTTRGCPAAGFLTRAVQACVEDVAGVSHADVELTYEPEWSPDMAIPEARARFAVSDF